jgi:hypothetical protein
MLGYGQINTSGSGFDELIPFSFDWVWNSAASVFSYNTFFLYCLPFSDAWCPRIVVTVFRFNAC